MPTYTGTHHPLVNFFMDRVLIAADTALRTLFSTARASRPRPVVTGSAPPAPSLSDAERRQSGALMRVNHVGEICAQALYTGQAMATRNAALRAHFQHASRDEVDHLAWTASRLEELGSRPSLLNPLWYAGAFAIGALAGKISDNVSLGFVVETERQVAQHLDRHLDHLPASDRSSRAIVSQMRDDELRHAHDAQQAGAVELPAPVRGLMRAAAKVMTTTAHYI